MNKKIISVLTACAVMAVTMLSVAVPAFAAAPGDTISMVKYVDGQSNVTWKTSNVDSSKPNNSASMGTDKNDPWLQIHTGESSVATYWTSFGENKRIYGDYSMDITMKMEFDDPTKPGGGYLQFRGWKTTDAQGTWDAKPIDFRNNGELWVGTDGAVGATKLGKYKENEEYTFHIEGTLQRDEFFVTLTKGSLDNSAPEASGPVACSYKSYMNEMAAINYLYFSANKGGTAFAKNITLNVLPLEYSLDDSVVSDGVVAENVTEIPLVFNQAFYKENFDKITVYKGGNSTENKLKLGVDYTLRYDYQINSSKIPVSKPTLVLSEPTARDGKYYYIDLSGLKDVQEHEIPAGTQLVFMCPSDEDERAIAAAKQEVTQMLSPMDGIVTKDMALPASICPEGFTDNYINVAYEITGRGSTTDEEALAAFALADGVAKVTRSEYQGVGTAKDYELTVKATLSKIGQPDEVVTAQLTIPHQHALSGREFQGGAAALFDGFPSTTWSADGPKAELTIPLEPAVVITGWKAVGGAYDKLTVYAVRNGKETAVTTGETAPATSLHLVMEGSGALSLAELEIYSDHQKFLEYALSQIDIGNISNITDNYITLPREDEFGVKYQWTSSKPEVIDSYGTVRHTTSVETVMLTVKPLDETGTPIDSPNRVFSPVTVAAKKTGGSSGGGGGGGGSSTIKVPPSQPVIPSPGPTPTPKPGGGFADMDAAGLEWAVKPVAVLAEKGIVSGKGDGSFHPNDTVTREEFVKMLVAALEIAPQETASEFADVPQDAWFYDAVSKAVGAGIVGGVGDGRFGAGEAVTRQDIAVMMQRAIAFKELSLEAAGETPEFSDLDQARPDAVSAIEALAAAGILGGYEDGTIQPEGFATRAETAKMIYGVLDQLDLLT